MVKKKDPKKIFSYRFRARNPPNKLYYKILNFFIMEKKMNNSRNIKMSTINVSGSKA